MTHLCAGDVWPRFPKVCSCARFTPMIKLLRAFACLLIAVVMASVSLAATAHGTVIVDETSYHGETIISELPCGDCGSHRLRSCSQSCAALDALEPATPATLPAVDAQHQVGYELFGPGRSTKPPLTPPIA